MFPDAGIEPWIGVALTVGFICAFNGFTKHTRQLRGIVEDTEIYGLINKSAVHGGGAFILGFGGVSRMKRSTTFFTGKDNSDSSKNAFPATRRNSSCVTM
jgi:hypothetical protein